MRWTTLWKEKSQTVSEFTNSFHTLHTKMGIKDSKWHLVLKYHGALHRYIQNEMDFVNISSLGVAYRYVVKIKQKFRHQNKWEFGSANLKQPKHSKDTRKQCDFHKIPWHNTDECRSKKSLVVEVKHTELKPNLKSDPENIENR
jgi:hypothetical protein